MTARRVIAVRLPPTLVDEIDRQVAAGAAKDRTAWIEGAAARRALVGSGRTQAGDRVGDKPR
jgi:Arc/MetJ-type ribon-helix-helix transcriptional regulator